MTDTRVDHHHSSLQHSASGTSEGHLRGAGSVRCAASRVGALAAVMDLEGTSAVAALVNKPDGSW